MTLAVLASRLRSAFARHTSTIKIVAVQPLHHGAMLYVADIDDRRLIFAAAQRGVTLLTEYAAPKARSGEEPPSSVV